MPISTFITLIYAQGARGDSKTIGYKDQANETIKQFWGAPSTKENCQRLQAYLQDVVVDLMQCDQTKHRDEVIDELSDRIATLQTGIDAHMKRENPDFKPETKEQYWNGYVRRCEERAKVLVQYWEGIGRQPVTDPNTLEGYLRTIPGVGKLGLYSILNDHIEYIMTNFIPSNQEEIDGGDAGARHYAHRVVGEVAKTLTYIRYGPKVVQIDEDLYAFVQKLEKEPYVTVTTSLTLTPEPQTTSHEN